MKMKLLLLMTVLLVTYGMTSQEKFAPTEIVQGVFKYKTMRLDDFAALEENVIPEIPTMIIDQIVLDPLVKVNKPTNVIHNLQTEPGQLVSLPLEQNFIGASQSESGFLPPDPTGAAGPNHYVHSVNSLVKIFDKTGTLLVGPVNLSTFLGIGSNNGDPIVLYDQLADRWFVSEFGNLGSNLGLAIGVSETSDPAGAYNVYQFDLGGFPDYPHYGVWHDGYYGTANYIGGGQSVAGFVMERDALLAGDPSPEMVLWTNLPGNIGNQNQVRGGQPVNLLGTTIDPSTPGYFTYLQDDGWNAGITFDHLKVWEVELDWVTPANSTISAPLEIATDPFDAGELFGNGNGAIRQPGTSQRLAGHGGIVSHAANYRSFGTHNSWLITFNTFIDANETGGIRWIELRNDGVGDWSVYQEGTYSIADGHSRVMSSAAMDAQGNIALAYTTASTTLPVSLRYTGRYNGDPLGEMTVAENIIIDGPGVRTNTNRYGDYSHMTMDPDNFTFWYTGDYFSSNNQWRTQIAAITLSGGFTADVGVSNILQPNNGLLTAAETVEVTIRNYGSVAQSNIPVQLRVDGNLVASEVYPGTIAPNSNETFTFAQTVDLSTAGQTYSIEVKTALAGDQFAANDPYTKDVTHLLSNDVGALEITSPVSGSGLGSNETVAITLKNFGAVAQSNFDVQYSIDGGTPVVETFAGTIAAEEEVTYSFTQTGDFSVLGTYTVTAATSLAGDLDTSNDEVTQEIESVLCQPNLDCSFGDGFQLVAVAEINNVSACEGYGDFTDQIANLGAGETYDITFTTGYGDQNVKVWIDFNDDNTFDVSEVVVPNFVIAPGQGAGTFTETVSLQMPPNPPSGEHRMRAKSNWQAPVPNNACEETQYGETEDYTANVIGILGVDEIAISDSDFTIVSLPNNQFELYLNTSYDGGAYVGVFNLLGQEIGFNKRVPKIDSAYRLNLDMSKVATGVYIIKMGGLSTTSYKTGRIIVK